MCECFSECRGGQEKPGETFRVEGKAERGSRSRRGGLTDVRQNWPPLGRGGGAGGPVKEFGCNFRVMA